MTYRCVGGHIYRWRFVVFLYIEKNNLQREVAAELLTNFAERVKRKWERGKGVGAEQAMNLVFCGQRTGRANPVFAFFPVNLKTEKCSSTDWLTRVLALLQTLAQGDKI